MPNPQYSSNLDKNPANYVPLSPLTFIERAASVYPERCALIYNESHQTWADTCARCRRFADALQKLGVQEDDTVALMLPNVPAMYEAHFAIPMAGAVIHALNTRCRCDRVSAETWRCEGFTR
jgi:fatty-acyl-CoA synthase